MAAYQAAGFKVPSRNGREQQDLGANARRLANHKGVKARVAELASRAAQLASLDAGWAMLHLKGMVESNIDDYLSAPDEEGRRYFAIDTVSREKLGLLAELHQDEETEIGDPTPDGKTLTVRRIRKVKVKLPDRIAAIGQMARIAGWLAPQKVAPTNPAGDGPAEVTHRHEPMSPAELARRMSWVIEEAAAQAAVSSPAGAAAQSGDGVESDGE